MAMPSEEDRATATGKMHKKFGEVRHAVFQLCVQTDRQTDKQTDRQTDILITILRNNVSK